MHLKSKAVERVVSLPDLTSLQVALVDHKHSPRKRSSCLPYQFCYILEVLLLHVVLNEIHAVFDFILSTLAEGFPDHFECD